MVRISKQSERRAVSRRRPSKPQEKTGPKKPNLKLGYKEHGNALEGDQAKSAYIAKIK
jgi:hypothetical protein